MRGCGCRAALSHSRRSSATAVIVWKHNLSPALPSGGDLFRSISRSMTPWSRRPPGWLAPQACWVLEFVLWSGNFHLPLAQCVHGGAVGCARSGTLHAERNGLGNTHFVQADPVNHADRRWLGAEGGFAAVLLDPALSGQADGGVGRQTGARCVVQSGVPG
jgi:hypothetical protein